MVHLVKVKTKTSNKLQANQNKQQTLNNVKIDYENSTNNLQQQTGQVEAKSQQKNKENLMLMLSDYQ